jgi:hypothetical protein
MKNMLLLSFLKISSCEILCSLSSVVFTLKKKVFFSHSCFLSGKPGRRKRKI